MGSQALPWNPCRPGSARTSHRTESHGTVPRKVRIAVPSGPERRQSLGTRITACNSVGPREADPSEKSFREETFRLLAVGRCRISLHGVGADSGVSCSIDRCFSPSTDCTPCNRLGCGWLSLPSRRSVGRIVLGAFLLVSPRVTVFGIAILLLSSVLVHIVKLGFPSLRPVMLLDSVHVVGPLLRSGSFPSGHSAAAMSAGLAIAKFASSRTVAVGSHCRCCFGVTIEDFRGGSFSPEDVLGGAICAHAGVCAVGLAHMAQDRRTDPGVTVASRRCSGWLFMPKSGVSVCCLGVRVLFCRAPFGLWNCCIVNPCVSRECGMPDSPHMADSSGHVYNC